MRRVYGISVAGKIIDGQTRCTHYHSENDILAIKMRCCGTYYSCITCHEETAGHTHRRWRTDEFDEKALLCGSCGHEMTIREYLADSSVCPHCGKRFNPGCRLHHHLYFETEKKV
ncbi:CHY zinc finger protein [Alteribacter natronophilus]|uniref:CHY zinc finger protein n=1 Tax=Alteribacter natronophilus TaxID=2583810 RepID=UPI00110ECADF|nr:CHY zinc finger protein [Alteribacter natronophilus]TMW70455.1 hypothetical protein FGB90_17470 [Alteribacter natronophilus]